MVFDAHDQAFAFFGGSCTRGIYDSETLFAIGSRTMARGQVENQVQNSRDDLFKPRLHVKDFDELNDVVRERVLACATRPGDPPSQHLNWVGQGGRKRTFAALVTNGRNAQKVVIEALKPTAVIMTDYRK